MRNSWKATGWAVALALVLIWWAVPVSAAEPVTKKSPYDVAETLDRLETVLKEKGIRVMGRVDHSANAQTVGKTLRPTQVLIFGNPAIGTELMQIDQEVGLDLPMRVLAWEDEGGQTWLAYHDPATLAETYAGLEKDNGFLEKMAGALDGLTGAAVQR